MLTPTNHIINDVSQTCKRALHSSGFCGQKSILSRPNTVLKGLTRLTTHKQQVESPAAMMRALQKFLFFHALTCLGLNGKLLNLTVFLQPANVILTHFERLSPFFSHVFSTCE